MARPWRIEFAGALYHVLARGNEKHAIFIDDRDRVRFLELATEASERFELEIMAYALMPNHYHLLLRTRRPNLSIAMQWLGVSYAARFNRRHSRVGHLFQGRFKSILVQNESYMLRLSFYIHRNPVRAGLVHRLADYRWSSYRTYAYAKPAGIRLTTDLLFSQMKKAQDPHREYRESAQACAGEESAIWDDLHHGFILGSHDFLEGVRSRHLPTAVHVEIPQQKRLSHGVLADRQLRHAAAFLECDLGNCKLYGRAPRQITEARDLLIFLLWQNGGQTNAQIGAHFGLTPSAVSRRVSIVKHGLKSGRELQDRFEQLIRVVRELEPEQIESRKILKSQIKM